MIREAQTLTSSTVPWEARLMPEDGSWWVVTVGLPGGERRTCVYTTDVPNPQHHAEGMVAAHNRYIGAAPEESDPVAEEA